MFKLALKNGPNLSDLLPPDSEKHSGSIPCPLKAIVARLLALSLMEAFWA